MRRADEGTLLALTGGVRLPKRVQRPGIHERTDRGTSYWFFRYREDLVLPDGVVKVTRKFHTIGASRGPGALSRRQAELARDQFMAAKNGPATRVEAAVDARKPIDVNLILFGKLAEFWRRDYVEREIGGRHILARPTREKYISNLENHILPRWKETRLGDFRTKEISDWLQTTCRSWHAMEDLRNIMSGIISKVIEWEILPDSFANPIRRVKLPSKWNVREKRILSEDETVAVLAGLEDPVLLINETCISCGARISEVLGMQLRHVDLEKGTLRVEQRSWHQDIDKPKTERSRRTLAIAGLTERFRAWIPKLPDKGQNAWLFPQKGDSSKPMWDSGVRQELHAAAAAAGCDFPGLGPHSFRRANITWRQEVGGSSIEVSRIAGHSNVRMTEEYTVVQMKRQEELTRRIQEKLAKAKRRSSTLVEIKKRDTAA